MISAQQPINDEVERCAKNFWFVEQVASKPKQTPCYIDHNFTVIFKRPVISDREIVQEVITLAERVLVCPEYVPDQAVLKKPQDGVQAFIKRSTELSPEEKEYGFETTYLMRALLGTLLPEKCQHIAKLRKWQSTAKDSPVSNILRRGKIVHFDRGEAAGISTLRNTMYCSQKLLSVVVEFVKSQQAYFSEWYGFRDEILSNVVF